VGARYQRLAAPPPSHPSEAEDTVGVFRAPILYELKRLEREIAALDQVLKAAEPEADTSEEYNRRETLLSQLRQLLRAAADGGGGGESSSTLTPSGNHSERDTDVDGFSVYPPLNLPTGVKDDMWTTYRAGAFKELFEDVTFEQYCEDPQRVPTLDANTLTACNSRSKNSAVEVRSLCAVLCCCVPSSSAPLLLFFFALRLAPPP